MTLKEKIVSDMKVAMKAHDSARLSCIRLLLAAVKQREVDERIAPTDDVVTAVIGKLIKQRRDSVTQYKAAGREDLAAKESAEIDVLSAYMPQMMTEEVRAVVTSVVSEMGVSGMSAMGKVMGAVKGKLAGKADMSVVSSVVKSVLAG
jgi:gatB/yqey domain protein